MFKGINAIEFGQKFSNSADCYQYLMGIKWKNGYSCSRCGCRESIKGRTSYHLRCKACRYDESVIANTVFHGMKMPVLKAFHMVFRVAAKKKGMSTVELGTEVGVQQKTAWLFKRKIQVAMKQDQKKLGGKVDVDETVLGFHTDRKQGGRSLEKRKALMVAAEILEDGRTGNIRMEDIDDFKALTLKYAIENTIAPEAEIRTDNFVSYRTLQKNGMDNISIEESQGGKAFIEIHRQIMQFKNWLVGIHHRWSKEHLFAYADEYVFRFNNRNGRKRIFDDLINKMMHQIPHPYPMIRTLCAYST